MRVKDYARLIGRSEQFVRVACQQGQIKAIVIKHKSRHEYEILEVQNEDSKNNPVHGILHRDLDDIR